MNVQMLIGSGLRRMAAALVAAAAWSAWSAEPPAEPSFSVRSWSSDDGLPAAPAAALARTPDGYLWLATSVGLVRFDGARFVTFTTSTTPALGDSRISCLLVETNGTLWIGTGGGTLARRKNGDFEAVPLDARLRGRAINSLALGQEGELWLATTGCRAVRLRGGVWGLLHSYQWTAGRRVQHAGRQSTGGNVGANAGWIEDAGGWAMAE